MAQVPFASSRLAYSTYKIGTVPKMGLTQRCPGYYNKRVMRMNTPASFLRRTGLFVALPVFSAAFLCSCEEKEEPAPAAPAATEEPAAPKEDPAKAAEEAREALYHQLLENVAPLVTSNAGVPEFNEPCKVYLETLQQFYGKLSALPPSWERADIAFRVAELTRNLGAHAKAIEAYATAVADFEALPEEERSSVDGKRRHSALLNGTGVCLLSTGKAAEAIPYYEKALETDISVLRALGVAEETSLPENNPDANVSRAVADVLGSYRCLGESHLVIGDLEEARDIYKKGIAEMTSLKQLDVNSGMGIAYVKLHSALGDLENRCGNEREALASWTQAATLCNAIFNNTRQVTVKVQAKRFFDALSPLIVEKNRKMQEEAAAAAKAEEAAKVAQEAEARAAEEAAAKAVEEARAAEEAAKAAAEAEKPAPEVRQEEPREERPRRRSRRRNR